MSTVKSALFAGFVAVAVGCDSPKVTNTGGGTAIETSATTVAASDTHSADKEVALQLKNFDELQQLIAAKKGKIVVVDVWSTYCEPCMKEFPGLVDLHKKHGPEKVACISVCANFAGLGKPEDEIAEPLQFLKDQGATFDNVLSTDPDTKLYERLKIASVPTIFVYDRDGKLVKTFDGEPKYADVADLVATLVK